MVWAHPSCYSIPPTSYLWEWFWGENERTPQKWAPFCLCLSSRKVSASPLLPLLFLSGTRLQDLVLKGQRQQRPSTAGLNQQRRGSGCHWGRTGGVEPQPSWRQPPDNSWAEPGPAELSWKEEAEWLEKHQRPAGPPPAQRGGRNSSTCRCAELSPAEQWLSLTQGIYLSLDFIVSGWGVWEMLAMGLPLLSCLCFPWPWWQCVWTVTALPLSGEAKWTQPTVTICHLFVSSQRWTPFCWVKHLLFLYAFAIIIAVVNVHFLFHGFVLSVNCYLNP